ncbi:SDR family oxidoreductase [candidate division KSB1 bacterium]|nr:SDR family oxidoreductase [candidate division KSB1 bacterium]
MIQSTKHRLFITGVSGLLGGHLYRLAAPKNDTWGGFFTTSIPNLKQTVQFDIRQPQLIKRTLQTIKPDVVLHTAAISHLDVCQTDPEMAFAVNTDAVRFLAEICADLDIRLIFTSSDMVFDGEDGYYKEENRVAPLSVYGRTKVSAEKAVSSLCRDYVNVRLALIYGKPSFGGTSFSEWIEKRLQAGKTVPLFYDQYRSPVLVDNAAEALLELAAGDFTGVLHLAGSERIDRYRFGCLLASEGRYPHDLLQPVSMSSLPSAAPRPRDVSLCIERAESVLETRLLSPYEGILKMKNNDRRNLQ